MDDFSSFVREHEKKVYNMCLRSCGDPDDAFDLSQEVFIKAWRGLENFRGDSSLSTWLYRLTFNVCADFARKKVRKRDTVPFEETIITDDRYEPALVLENRELARALEDALAQLSPEQRHILALRETAGLSYQAIGEVLSIEEGTVKSRIARARMALRDIIQKSGNYSKALTSNEKKQKKRGGGGRHGTL